MFPTSRFGRAALVALFETHTHTPVCTYVDNSRRAGCLQVVGGKVRWKLLVELVVAKVFQLELHCRNHILDVIRRQHVWMHDAKHTDARCS